MDKIEEVLTRGVEKIYPSKEALEKVLRSGEKLNIYWGADPSAPDIHLGHTIGLRKLKEFQDLGHKVIFLVGDFTAQIGDPSDKTAMRRQLSHQEVLKNAKTYRQQAKKILDFESKTNPAEIKFNSQWLDKLTNKEVIELAACFTVQQMIERDLFQRRLKEGKPLGLHEFLYPLYQGYDSVAMDIDLEVEGGDQIFNMLCGRTLMKVLKGKEKFSLTVPLLEGTDGQKMSKSLGNAIGIAEPSNKMFGKIMSMKDELIIKYFEFCTEVPLQSIKSLEKELNPIDLKKRLAFEIVKMYYSEKEAQKAQEEFEQVFQKRNLPQENILVHEIKSVEKGDVLNILTESGLVSSRSEAKRLIAQGGVDIDGATIKEISEVKMKDGSIIKAGKRKFLKIKIKE